MLKLYNTLTRKKEVFQPLRNKRVHLYTCGPTVYYFAHIGNLRTYIFEDVLKRVLEYNGYKVKHVMNITDVGHLTSDADTGEDKIEKAAEKEKKTAWQIARFYETAFKKDLKLLNIKEPNVWVRATETITEQIDLIKILEKKGFTYKISDGIYFDTSKLRSYGRLWPSKMKILPGKRVQIISGKKNPTDFALWKFSPPGIKRQMEWDSPWGRGFPGWHTECVVMSQKFLGIPFDIHCGGVDHILIHHTNEIAQAEAAFGKLLANFWLHGEFLILKKEKMAKSKGNVIILSDLIKEGFDPIAFRYLTFQTHYRSKMFFSFEALKSAQNTLKNLIFKIQDFLSHQNNLNFTIVKKGLYERYREEFLKYINDDLNLPKALAFFWKMLGDEKLSLAERYFLSLDFDKVFGLGLEKIKKIKIPSKIKKLVLKREKLRKKGEFKKADKIREMIKKMGFIIEDTKEGPKIKKLN